MAKSSVAEDTHFYIDNAPPEEVKYVLQVLDPEEPKSTSEIALTIESLYGFSMQKDRTYSPRRLFDLGLAEQTRSRKGAMYVLSDPGMKVRDILSFDPELYSDLTHYLHFTTYNGTPGCRKLLWSYRQCSQIAWEDRKALSRTEIAARVQGNMQEQFSHLDFTARVGARFDATAVGRWLQWIRQLSPNPSPEGSDSLAKRTVHHHELALLALDDVYRARGYRYGDPVILDDRMLDAVARVFFLEPTCCRELIDLSARLTRTIELSDTFAGTSVSLLFPYGIERI